MNDLLKEYIAMYGKSNWSLSTYSANVNMIKNYIQPHLLSAISKSDKVQTHLSSIEISALPLVQLLHPQSSDFRRPCPLNNHNDIVKIS